MKIFPLAPLCLLLATCRPTPLETPEEWRNQYYPRGQLIDRCADGGHKDRLLELLPGDIFYISEPCSLPGIRSIQ